jgi:hypothetical protein
MGSEYAAPDGAEIHFGFGSTNMPRLKALGKVGVAARRQTAANSSALFQMAALCRVAATPNRE